MGRLLTINLRRSLGAKQGGATSGSPDGFIQTLRGDKVDLAAVSRCERSRIVQPSCQPAFGSPRRLVQHSRKAARSGTPSAGSVEWFGVRVVDDVDASRP